MFLSWLKNDLNLDFTSWLFNSNKSTGSQMLISWIELSLIFPKSNANQIRQSMPDSFKNAYPNTVFILDSTKLFCQSPS